MKKKMPYTPEGQYRRPPWATQQVVRASGLVEDVCKHGVGHPNRDWLAQHDPKGKTGLEIHGCCGCCPREKTVELGDKKVVVKYPRKSVSYEKGSKRIEELFKRVEDLVDHEEVKE